MKSGGLVSVATAALVATIAGVGGTLPIVLAAAQSRGRHAGADEFVGVGPRPRHGDQRAGLSVRYRMPIIAAWSTPAPH